MRLLVLAAAAAAVPAASAEEPAPTKTDSAEYATAAKPAAIGQKCRRPDAHRADRRGPVEFKRLDQLPQATAYMAVYRTVDGCEEPMTVVEYRQGGRR